MMMLRTCNIIGVCAMISAAAVMEIVRCHIQVI